MTPVTLAQSPEFTIRGEFLWFGVILHGDVHVPWTKGVRKRVRDAIALIARSISLPVYAFQTPSHDPKKRKFIRDTGGIYDHRRQTDEGEWAEMYLYRPMDCSKGDPDGKPLQI
jgi:hypothetical protein